VRVIAGTFRSRPLIGPGRLKMRPTSDRLRETLFNVLGPTVDDSLFIDVCAGTGAVGIEALSRGARHAAFIESQTGAAQIIKQNLSSLGIGSSAELIQADAIQGLENLASRRLVADFIFLDPPYDEEDLYIRTLEFIDASHLVAPRGIVIVEHRNGFRLPEIFDRLELARLLEQGDAALSFYRPAAAA
jgi:16S rRNA (guanine966-N2)-methyltransferase